MFNHSLASNRLVSLLLAFLIAACSSTANTPPPSPSPIVLATLPSAPTSLPVTRPAATATKIVTPTPEPIKFPGYENVEYLPNDIFLQKSQPNPENVIQSLAFSPIGGMNGCIFGGDDTDDFEMSLEDSQVYVINYCLSFDEDTQITIALTKPDGSTVSQTGRYQDLAVFHSLDFRVATVYPKMGLWNPVDGSICIDPVHLLMPGSYELRIFISNITFTDSFEFRFPEATRPTVFLGDACRDTINEGQPALIFYAGFVPDETLKVTLYRYASQKYYEDSQYQLANFDGIIETVNVWTAKTDANGRLIEYIAVPQLPGPGIYVLVAEGRERNMLRVGPLEIEGSAALLFEGTVDKANIRVDESPPGTAPHGPSPSHIERLSTLVYIPAGEFNMGSASGADPFAEKVERPQHTVYVSDFWIQRTEVRNGHYAECVRASACTLPLNIASKMRPDYYTSYRGYPVVNITYAQAQAYCAWAGGRLPTEAEWEKAARYPDNRLYPWGNAKPNNSLANYDNSQEDTTPVIFVGNDFSIPGGLANMAGNVWEWVADWYDPNYYSASPDKDPTGPATGKERVVRGGSYRSEPQFLRTTNRFSSDPNKGSMSIGFRCVTTTAP